MTKADLTRKHIARTFKDMMALRSYQAITIQAIAQSAEVSRKTFYYYFFSKADLVCYVFREELSEVLKRSFPADELVCDTELESDKYRSFPFFTRDAVGNHDKGRFFRVLSRYFQCNEAYYRALSHCEDWAFFENYLVDIYRPQFKQTIELFFEEDGVAAPPDEVDYLSSYYAYSTVPWVLHRHVTKRNHYSEETKDNLQNLFYDIIRHSVKTQVERIRGGGSEP